MVKTKIAALVFLLCIIELAPTENCYGAPTIREGWPVQLGGAWGATKRNKIAVGKLPSIGNVIAISTVHQIAVFTQDGEMLPGWPVVYPDGQYILAGPVLGDVNNDGIFELTIRLFFDHWFMRVMTYTPFADSLEHLCYTRDLVVGDEDYPRGSPVFADITGDDGDELLFVDDSLFAYGADGELVEGFPWDIGDHAQRRSTIVVIDDSEAPVLAWLTYWNLHARRVGEPNELPGYPFPLRSRRHYSHPSALPTVEGWSIALASEDSLSTYNQNGERLIRMRTVEDALSPFTTSIAIADVSGDLTADFVYPISNGPIMAVAQDGSVIQGFPYEYNGPSGSDPIVCIKPGYWEETHFFRSRVPVDDSMLLLEGYSTNEPLPGYPFSIMTESEYAAKSPCVVFKSSSDSLLLAQYSFSSGQLWVYDLHEHMAGMRMEWQHPSNTAGGNAFYQPYDIITSVEEPERSKVPFDLFLTPPYPNPGNSTFAFDLRVPAAGEYSILVRNLLGQLVCHDTIEAGYAGRHRWVWDAHSMSTGHLSSGTYYVQLAGYPGTTRSLVLLK